MFVRRAVCLFSGLLQLTLYILWPPKHPLTLFLQYFVDDHTVYLHAQALNCCQYVRPFNWASPNLNHR